MNFGGKFENLYMIRWYHTSVINTRITVSLPFFIHCMSVGESGGEYKTILFCCYIFFCHTLKVMGNGRAGASHIIADIMLCV